ncbi:hypothetical protein J6590_014724 [Homalodisca vitripennis]|nr:hypothetical protein J6590_014724 [Homalodisca vitripennis]
MFATGTDVTLYQCSCGRRYRQKATWYRHRRYECGKAPQFWCLFCSYCAKRKGTLDDHIKIKHVDQLSVLRQAS